MISFKNKCIELNSYEFFVFSFIFNTDVRFPSLAEHLEGEVLEIGLNLSIVKFSTNKTFCIEDTKIQISIISNNMKRCRYVRVIGVHGDLVLCSIANQTFIVGEGDIGGSCAISLIVCNNFYTIVLPHPYATKKYIRTMKKMKKLKDAHE
jgi:hypothetical protein